MTTVRVRTFEGPDGRYLNQDDVVKFLTEYGMNILDAVDEIGPLTPYVTRPLVFASNALARIGTDGY